MESNQPPSTSIPPSTYTPASAAPGMFGTKIPSVVTFAIAVFLFFMPFIDIKCNGTSLQTVNGISLATGFSMKNSNSGSSLFGDMDDKEDTGTTTTTKKTEKKEPNMYALVAMGLGVLGLILSFTNAKAAIGGAMITGIASAGAMIGLMLDIKKKINTDIPGTGKSSSGDDSGISEGIEKIGREVNDKLNITVDFTPWFYIAVLAFLAAAFFCYKRLSAQKT